VKIRCSVCGSVFHLPPKIFNRELMGFPAFCSVDCLESRIKMVPATSSPDSLHAFPDVLLGQKRVIGSDQWVFSTVTGEAYRSHLEKDTAEWLTRIGEPFLYEPCTFTLPGSVSEKAHYTPDFYLPARMLFLEDKGLWGFGAKSKFVRFTEHRPDVDILLVPVRLQSEIRRAG
jgi:hypothetical protein